ncbi:MAG: hypothetical protein AAGK37_22450 [Pseudomonadota bacterium]
MVRFISIAAVLLTASGAIAQDADADVPFAGLFLGAGLGLAD